VEPFPNQPAAAESTHNRAARGGSEIERILPTLCRHRKSPPLRKTTLPDALTYLAKAGLARHHHSV